jgi:hypothetical protein
VGLPGEIRVRISSEAAGSISMTPVVTQGMPLRDVVQAILATTGKDVVRVRDILRRGAVVQGASRLRWEPLAAEDQDVIEFLRLFPDPDPSRRFAAERCIGVRLRAGRQTIELPRQVAAERRWLKRRSFWDTLMEMASRAALEYVDYSYRTRADEYRVTVSPSDLRELRQAADLLRYSGLTAQIRLLGIEAIEYSVRFP